MKLIAESANELLVRSSARTLLQKMPKYLMVLSSPLWVSPVYAIDPIPQESGVSGFISLGAGVANVESNFLSSTLNGNVDIGDEKISSLGSPSGETFAMPAVAFELTYTFAESRTQIFFGPKLEDFLRFDLTTSFGVRQELGNAGVVALSTLQAPIKSKVWRDPYQTDVKRSDTDTDSSGYRFEWSKVFGTPIGFRYTAKEVNVDTELSGTNFIDPDTGALSNAEIASLDRNGDVSQIDIRYRWVANDANGVLFTLSSIEHDLDGSAMSYDGYKVQANYIHTFNKRERMVTNFSYGDFEYDQSNPVFDDYADKEQLGLTVSYFRSEPFGIKDWVGNVGFVYASENSDVDFFDTQVMMVNFGMLTRF